MATKRRRAARKAPELATAAAAAATLIANAARDAAVLTDDAAKRAKDLLSQSAALMLSEEKLKTVITQAVHDVFVRAGLDMDHPIEVQKDFAHLRSMRYLMERGGTRAFLTIITVVVAGAFAAMLVGLGVPAKILAVLGLARGSN